MKRSRIILGMAALGVAAFGAFAFTSKTEATAIPAFYKPTSTTCVEADEMTNCNEDGLECVGNPGTAEANQQLYRDSSCQQSLQREQGF